MAITKYDDFIAAIGGNKYAVYPFWNEVTSNLVSFGQGSGLQFWRGGFCKLLPNPLPSGITNYIATCLFGMCSATTGGMLLCKLINLGSINIGTNVFTDGSAMPTATELGVTNTIASPVFCEVTTALNATPGNLTVTYIDQDNNTAETTATVAMPASGPVGNGGIVPLNSPDWGVIDLTNATQSGGTTPSGVIKFLGLIPLIMACSTGVTGFLDEAIDAIGFNPIRLNAGDELGIYMLSGSTSTRSMFGHVLLVGE